MKTVKEFMREFKENPELMNELMDVVTDEELKEFMKRKEITGTKAEFENGIVEYLTENNLVPDVAMAAVSGGVMNPGQKNINDVVYCYNVGEIVNVLRFMCFSKRGTIVGRSIEKDLTDGNYYPSYTINLDCGKTVTEAEKSLYR